MEFKIQELSEKHMKFVISDIVPSFVNTIRRVLIANVPKMAIEDVEFHLGPIRDSSGKEYESISPLFDEIIAHRLGLIPISTDLKLFSFREECDCKGEGCPNCTIMYNLNKKGPCTVYSGDLEPLGDTKFKIKEDLIPVVKLGKNQALLIYATAELGTCKKHAKWQPTSGVGYKYYPRIEIENKLITDDKMIDACIEICPKNILERKKDKLVVRDNIENCLLCDSCVEVCRSWGEEEKEYEEGEEDKKDMITKDKMIEEETKLPIKIMGDDSKFIFTFETDGSMDVKDAFEFSLKFLEDKFNDFREQVSKIK